PPPLPTPFPYTTLFRSPSPAEGLRGPSGRRHHERRHERHPREPFPVIRGKRGRESESPGGYRDGRQRTSRGDTEAVRRCFAKMRSEEHTSELQSPYDLV